MSYLEHIGNNIPNIVFKSVTYLKLWHKDAFKHEFFVRLARAFPFLKNLSIWNIKPPFFRFHERHLLNKDWCSIVEYPRLISLDIECVKNTLTLNKVPINTEKEDKIDDEDEFNAGDGVVDMDGIQDENYR